MKLSFYLQCDVFSNNIYLLKTCFPKILTQISQGKQSGNNADAVLNDFTDLESESSKVMFDTLSDNAMLIIQKTKITTCDVPGYKQSHLTLHI